MLVFITHALCPQFAPDSVPFDDDIDERHYFFFEVQRSYLHLPRLLSGCGNYRAEHQTYNEGQPFENGHNWSYRMPNAALSCTPSLLKHDDLASYLHRNPTDIEAIQRHFCLHPVQTSEYVPLSTA